MMSRIAGMAVALDYLQPTISEQSETAKILGQHWFRLWLHDGTKPLPESGWLMIMLYNIQLRKIHELIPQ